MVLPSLQFSGVSAPTVEEFMTALEAQIAATRSTRVEGQIASRLSGRALLWYEHCTTQPEPHLIHSEQAYNALREQLEDMFSHERSTPQTPFNGLTQGGFTTFEYFEKYRQLAAAAEDGIDNHFRRLWWVYGLQPELRNIGIDRMAIVPIFPLLVHAVHAAEWRLIHKYTPRVKFHLTPIAEAPTSPMGRPNGA